MVYKLGLKRLSKRVLNCSELACIFSSNYDSSLTICSDKVCLLSYIVFSVTSN